jgi:hypothetical protein
MPKGLTAIYTQVVGAGGVSAVTFNNIPQNYTDIKVVFSARETASTPYSGTYLTLNNNGASLYSTTLLEGYGSVASSRTSNQGSFFPVPHVPGGSSTANTFGSSEIYISNYSTTLFKSLIMDSASENNSASSFSFQQGLTAGLYRSNAPISLFKITSAGTFAQHSTFTLYGISR